MTDPYTEHAEAAHGTDDGGVLAIMHYRAVENEDESRIQGMPVFEEKAFVKILTGDKHNIIIQELNDDHKRRWPEVWKAFQAKKAGIASGTPIHEMTVLNRAQVATLRAIGVVTVEQLAALPDERLNMSVTRTMRERARQTLQGSSETEKELRREAAALERQVKDMAVRIAQLEAALASNEQPKRETQRALPPAGETQRRKPAAAKRKPGRPRKAV